MIPHVRNGTKAFVTHKTSSTHFLFLLISFLDLIPYLILVVIVDIVIGYSDIIDDVVGIGVDSDNDKWCDNNNDKQHVLVFLFSSSFFDFEMIRTF